MATCRHRGRDGKGHCCRRSGSSSSKTLRQAQRAQTRRRRTAWMGMIRVAARQTQTNRLRQSHRRMLSNPGSHRRHKVLDPTRGSQQLRHEYKWLSAGQNNTARRTRIDRDRRDHFRGPPTPMMKDLWYGHSPFNASCRANYESV